MIDIIVVAVVLLCALRGWLRGVLVGLLSLAALVAAYLGANAAAQGVSNMIAVNSKLSVAWSYALAWIGSAVLIFISVRLCGALVERAIGRDQYGAVREWNRRLGLLTGLVVGVLGSLAFLVVLDCYVKASKGTGAFYRHAQASRLRRLISEYNPADRFNLDVLWRIFMAGRENPAVWAELKTKEPVQELHKHEAVQRVLEDKQLRLALEQKRVGDVLANENLKTVLAEREVRRQLFSSQMRRALLEVIEWAERNPPKPDEIESDAGPPAAE